MHARRHLGRGLVVALLTLASVACYAAGTLADNTLWECNFCHQQYQGDSPPRFAKCPEKDMKQNHWWIKKR